MNNIIDSTIDEQCILLIGCEDQCKIWQIYAKTNIFDDNLGVLKV